ncbi:MAG TPA: PEP-CTERM sorting domain-containing protein [Pirellulales bacterium]|jgi:hypothetical protein
MTRTFVGKYFYATMTLVSLTITSNLAHAGALNTPVLPVWGRPTTNAQATANLSTYQEWNSMSPTASVPTSGSPLAAPTLLNPNAGGSVQPVFYDSTAPGDGAFQAGTDIYSFSGVLTPVVVIPGYNQAGHNLRVSIEVQSFGSLIDPTNLTATYTDPGGNAHSFQVNTLPSYAYSQAFNDGGSDFGGLGTAYTVDNLWTFTLPQDTSSLTLTLGWGVTSAAIEAVSVDTHASAVPEPSTVALSLMAGLGSVVLWNVRRRKESRS